MNGRLTLDGMDKRVTVLERDLLELTELVDGQEEWSHRKRLHKLDSDAAAAELAKAALAAYHRQRDHVMTRVREWGSFALAGAAILLSAHPWS